MFGGHSGGAMANSSTLAVKGVSKAVPFSRSVTAADTAFASTTVVFPRSSRPKAIRFTASANALFQVQGMGPELYSGSIAANVPSELNISDYPEVTAITVQTEIFASGAVGGAVEYT